jgi:hypothetical protein
VTATYLTAAAGPSGATALEDASAARRSASTAGWRGAAGRLVGQTALLTSAAAAYFSVRSVTEGDPATAVANAERVIALEQTVGLDVEPALQALVLPVDSLVVLANWVYVFGHWPVLIGVLGWLAVRHPLRFVELRNALLLSGAVGMLVFAVLPVAPPRLLDHGDLAVMVDTVLEHSRAYRVLQPPAFTNQYAAVPSLHVGWDLLAGIAIATTARRRWARLLGAVLPVLMLLAVLVTANHYVLDAVAGAALALASLAVVRHRARRQAAALEQRQRVTGIPTAIQPARSTVA